MSFLDTFALFQQQNNPIVVTNDGSFIGSIGVSQRVFTTVTSIGNSVISPNNLVSTLEGGGLILAYTFGSSSVNLSNQDIIFELKEGGRVVVSVSITDISRRVVDRGKVSNTPGTIIFSPSDFRGADLTQIKSIFIRLSQGLVLRPIVLRASGGSGGSGGSSSICGY